MNGSLSFDAGDRKVHILWHDITAVQEATGHVLAVARVALDHLRKSLAKVMIYQCVHMFGY